MAQNVEMRFAFCVCSGISHEVCCDLKMDLADPCEALAVMGLHCSHKAYTATACYIAACHVNQVFNAEQQDVT